MAKIGKQTRTVGIGAALVGAVIALALMTGPAAAERRSAVYCVKGPGDTLKIFAARRQPNGRILFGISLWNVEGNNIGVYGVAERQGGQWVYSESLDPDDHCKLVISFSSKGAAHIVADPDADCHERGGHGTSIGSVIFPKSADEGPVTFELNDPETFFDSAGKC